jgi:hypothetical protein
MKLLKITPSPKNPHDQALKAFIYLVKYGFALVIGILYKIISKPAVTIPLLVAVFISIVSYTYGLKDAPVNLQYVYRDNQKELQYIDVRTIEEIETIEASLGEDNLVFDEDLFESIIEKKKTKVKVTEKTCHLTIKELLPSFKAVEKTYKIPVAIVAAQYLLESNAGQSRLAKKANNFFGIKYTKNIKEFSKKDERGNPVVLRAHDDCCKGRGCSNPDKFAVFESPYKCFMAYGKFLKQKRYKKLFRSRYYKDWAYGLKECGYATDPNYAKSLIKIIQKYELNNL